MARLHSLGTGVLTWDAIERRSDRYGAVWLMPDGYNSSMSESEPPSLVRAESVDAFKGRRGHLFAVVVATRKSTHIGDLFHGVFPRIPEVGQVIELGQGDLFRSNNYVGGTAVGVRPADGRDTMWMDIRALYDAHEQTVELFFSPAEDA